VLYNASARAHGPLAELDPEGVRKAIEIAAFGGFLTVREAARRMIPHGRGAILLTGASASVKGYAHSAAVVMGKFALRGPDGIAQTYVEVLRRLRSAWSLEVELRPWVETF
jgi:NAD(P)-dependent dehydrogenase (short-subunit alcohol dehydrogenase family)